MVSANSATSPLPEADVSRYPGPALPLGGERLLAGGFLLIAVVFGGGGTPAPLPELVVELVALGLIAWLIGLRHPPATLPARALLLLSGAWIALPLIQLIPLPPDLWRQLPGRAALVAAQDALGQGQAWWPLAISPVRTVASLLSLCVPLAALLVVSSLHDASRPWLARALVALALVAGLAGVVQVLSGDGWLYGRVEGGYASGLMANRNAFADFMLIALMAHICWPATASPVGRRRGNSSAAERWIARLIGLFLVLCVFLSGSRTGFALLVMPLAVLALRRGRGLIALGAFACGVAALVAAASISPSSSSATRIFGRFSAQGDPRISALWPDSLYAARQVWPVGVGVGGFKPEFDSVERLSVVIDREPNRAHQDYLELAIEAGAAGLGLLAASALLLARQTARALGDARGNRARQAELLFAIGTISVIAAHALVDYPVRCMTLAVLLSWAVALLYRAPDGAAAGHGAEWKRATD